MDVEILARLQFAVTIMFHYIYPPLSIGLGLALVFMEGTYLVTKNPLYHQMAKFWTKVFALTFAIGVATGIVMEFEFGTNWSTYSRYVGDVFGSALAAEGVFAFFLESGFLAILLFGWDRVKPWVHFFATLMVCLGAHFSAVWIVVANSWMQTPAGFVIAGEGIQARAEITDFWAMVFNPSSMMRLSHTLIGAWLAGAFLVISVSAYYLLKKRHSEFSKASLKIGLMLSLVSVILQVITGDASGKIVAEYQPAKLAAIEGVYVTEKGAPLYLIGIPNPEEKRVDYGIKIPKLLSYLSKGEWDAEIMGLDQVPAKDWPQSRSLFPVFRLMIGMWVLMVIVTIWAFWRLYQHKLETSPWLLRALTLSVLFPQLANQAGWYSAEVGRYPWIVYNHLRISEGLSKAVTANQVLSSLIMFGIIYSLLFAVFLYLLHQKIMHGPTDMDKDLVYQSQKRIVKEIEKQ